MWTFDANVWQDSRLYRGRYWQAIVLRILIIDDDPLVRGALTVMLTSLGYEPVATSGTLEGLQQAEAGHFDAALIDMNMPGLDGLEAVKSVARMTPRIPVVGMSGGSTDPDIDYAILAVGMGAQTFLRKPFTREQLSSTLQAVTNSQA